MFWDAVKCTLKILFKIVFKPSGELVQVSPDRFRFNFRSKWAVFLWYSNSLTFLTITTIPERANSEIRSISLFWLRKDKKGHPSQSNCFNRCVWSSIFADVFLASTLKIDPMERSDFPRAPQVGNREKRGKCPPPPTNQPGIIRLGRSRSIKDTKRGSCMAYVFRGQWVFLLASCLSFETGLGISKHMCAKALIFSPTRKQQHPQLERKKRIKLISRSKFAGGGKSSEQNFSILWLCKLLRFSGLRIESTQFEYHSHCCCGKLGANFGVAWQSSLSF